MEQKRIRPVGIRQTKVSNVRETDSDGCVKEYRKEETEEREAMGVRAPYLFLSIAKPWDLEVSKAACKIAWVLVRLMEHKNLVLLSRKEIAEIVGMEKTTVYRAIKELEKVGFLNVTSHGFVLDQFMVGRKWRTNK